MKKTRLTLLMAVMLMPFQSLAQSTPIESAAPGEIMERVWHLGRVTGDLERIIHFYHDLLGLGFRGERQAIIPFYSVDAINEFVNAPVNAEFRAAFMPIPGASNETDPMQQIYLEAFEYRNITRHQMIPALSDIGVSNLTFLVHDLDELVSTLDEAGVAFITAGKQPIPVSTPLWLNGESKAVMVRDPDGYPVILMENVSSNGTAQTSQVFGASMTVIVENLDTAMHFYRTLIDTDLKVWENLSWHQYQDFGLLRDMSTDTLEVRSASVLLPGSAIVLELVQLRGVTQERYQPLFQDIGFGHVAFMTSDIEEVARRMNLLDITSLSQSGSWTQINPELRAVYTRDKDGFFLEVIE